MDDPNLSTRKIKSGFGPQLSLSYDSGAGNGPSRRVRSSRKIPQARLCLLDRFPYGRSHVNSAALVPDRALPLVSVDPSDFSSMRWMTYGRAATIDT
jgi:hypothetical protein